MEEKNKARSADPTETDFSKLFSFYYFCCSIFSNESIILNFMHNCITKKIEEEENERITFQYASKEEISKKGMNSFFKTTKKYILKIKSSYLLLYIKMKIKYFTYILTVL